MRRSPEIPDLFKIGTVYFAIHVAIRCKVNADGVGRLDPENARARRVEAGHQNVFALSIDPGTHGLLHIGGRVFGGVRFHQRRMQAVNRREHNAGHRVSATISSISDKPLADWPEGVQVFGVPEKTETIPVMSRFLD